jgi:hypothetical protein
VKLRIADDVVFRIIGNEVVIQKVGTGDCFNLDKIGTRMWQLISDHRSREDVIAALLDEYDVDEEQLCHDLDALIEQLIAKGLLKTELEER